jgi:hypothetical protein
VGLTISNTNRKVNWFLNNFITIFIIIRFFLVWLSLFHRFFPKEPVIRTPILTFNFLKPTLIITKCCILEIKHTKCVLFIMIEWFFSASAPENEERREEHNGWAGIAAFGGNRKAFRRR